MHRPLPSRKIKFTYNSRFEPRSKPASFLGSSPRLQPSARATETLVHLGPGTSPWCRGAPLGTVHTCSEEGQKQVGLPFDSLVQLIFPDG